ncbi:MAG: acyl carrier protein [Symploca sp. SIO3C6]|uniref:Acyl carrier protein n=1 Tax=Symploca sp. SIO1C4 TaxID=2607765 RepID=A0A6B3NHF4_9CYAN|nr:acyl carrier protein [Symploca sp. SIO3C6]NER29982.1 acyl carrier protein [Symploca sp. SIO1C4]NET04645.1 acyl carrier protein [Symploca sp. SIO2B6]
MEIKATNTSILTESDRQKLLSMIRESVEDIEDIKNLDFDEETSLRGLPGFDSLKMLKFLSKVEMEFFITLGLESLLHIHTLADLYAAVAKAQEEALARQSSRA